MTANAHRIFAADELYEALAAIIATDPNGETWQWQRGRAALNKANGEQVHSDPLPKQVGR